MQIYSLLECIMSLALIAGHVFLFRKSSTTCLSPKKKKQTSYRKNLKRKNPFVSLSKSCDSKCMTWWSVICDLVFLKVKGIKSCLSHLKVRHRYWISLWFFRLSESQTAGKSPRICPRNQIQLYCIHFHSIWKSVSTGRVVSDSGEIYGNANNLRIFYSIRTIIPHFFGW